jgi:proline iminopeptidase
MLAEHLHVIRWDQRGSGRSERRGPYSVAQSLADLDTVRSHLGLDKVALLGHSWGAQLALCYALDHPDRVSDLVYVSGTGLGWAWREPFERNIIRRQTPSRPRIAALKDRDRTEAEDRELAILQWSAEFADTATARHNAEQMATPWFGINHECNAAINKEMKRTWREPELTAACRALTVRTLILDGAEDIRPRWAVDSLEQALPAVIRVTLDAGHVPWLEVPDQFTSALLDFLCRSQTDWQDLSRHVRQSKERSCRRKSKAPPCPSWKSPSSPASSSSPATASSPG